MISLWQAALIGAAVLAGAVVARRRWDAVSPRVWWREQRLHRRPGQIIGRLLRVPLVALLLVASTVVAILGVGLLLLALTAVAALIVLWWWLRCGARSATPHREMYERDDVDLTPPDPDLNLDCFPRVLGPPLASPPALPPEDPDNPRALEW
ncbi:hypothetical protein AB0F17_28575 [Nonomuraea sp. NPDC026600]|uniref:hypothetical protein n=1 Tax=Nonomuraea sp. NPDC026600 TaxID=3155363 RepID=UPI00340E94AF